MMKYVEISAIAACLSALATVSALADGQSPPPAAGSPAACLKAVNVLGASMGHTETTSADGRLTYKFRLRTNGLDYDASCDAATGVVGDVTPRITPSTDSAS